MTKDELKTKVFESLGAASMCWIPRPFEQEFDSTRCSQIGNELWQSIDELLSEKTTEALNKQP